MSVVGRKAFEINGKIASFARELDEWRNLANGPDKLLRKHHTQIERVTRQLGELAMAIGAVAENGALASARATERQVLDLYRLWDFFRSKFAQRNVTHHFHYLYACDELAWECYRPVQGLVTKAHLALTATKEPPLVYFNTVSSPAVSPRDLPYRVDGLAEGTSRREDVERALRRLPIPVIGVPWFQASHLPDMLVVAHEVGHVVEDDLKLTARIAALLDASNINANRREAWRSWAGETFADMFATVALGPAFVGALMDFLATGPAAVAAEVKRGAPWGAYPTTDLRIHLCCAALDLLGFAAEARALLADWRKDFTPSPEMRPFYDDVAPVAGALVAGKYDELGGTPLAAVLGATHTADLHEAATADATRLLDPGKLTPEQTDVRYLAAAARLAFAKDPAQFTRERLDLRVLAAVEQTPGTRGSARAADDADLEAADRAAGRDLLSLLG